MLRCDGVARRARGNEATLQPPRQPFHGLASTNSAELRVEVARRGIGVTLAIFVHVLHLANPRFQEECMVGPVGRRQKQERGSHVKCGAAKDSAPARSGILC